MAGNILLTTHKYLLHKTLFDDLILWNNKKLLSMDVTYALSNYRMNGVNFATEKMHFSDVLSSAMLQGNLARLTSATTAIDRLTNPLSQFGKFGIFEHNYKLESLLNSVNRINAVVPRFDHFRTNGAIHAVTEMLKSENALSLINDQQYKWNNYLNSVLHHNGALTAIEQLTKSTPFVDQINDISSKIQTAYSQTLSYAYETEDTETIAVLESDQEVLDFLTEAIKKYGTQVSDKALEVIDDFKVYFRDSIITPVFHEKFKNVAKDYGIIKFVYLVLQKIYEWLISLIN